MRPLLAFFLILVCPSLWAGDFERMLPTEAQDIVRIREGIAFLQAQQAERSGVKLRGTHAKGVCALGELEILYLDESSPLKLGLFSRPGVYKSTVRFANAEGQILADQVPDVRAVSFAVETPRDITNEFGRMDFAMNNAPTFPINDANVFANIMTLAQYGVVKGGWLIGLGGLWGAKQAVDLGELQKAPAFTAYQSMSYWSTVPFALGEDMAVKYKLSPCSTNSAEALTENPNTLSLEFKRHINRDEPSSCFDLKVQVLNADVMTDEHGQKHAAVEWVENATWLWREDQASFVTVGRLTLTRQSILSDVECEDLRVDVTRYTSPAHRGLGSINRARAAGERTSAANR